MTGAIVTKIAANSFATSAMGAQSNALPARALFGVSASEASSTTRAARRARDSAISTSRAEHVERDAGLPDAAHQHEHDDHREQREIDLAVDAERRRVGRRIEKGGSRVVPAPVDSCRAHRTRASSTPQTKSIGSARCTVVQKKPTPFRKPRKSGGSPSGVSEPPAFATRKMKNTTTCTTCLRLSFARKSGRISSMAAPVVPMTLASAVPSASSPVLRRGEPCRLPRTQIPPATV